jgi:hypothetical protein
MHDTPMRLAELPPRDLILVSADSASQLIMCTWSRHFVPCPTALA